MGSWNSGGWGRSYNSREINKRIHIDRKKCCRKTESWLTPQFRCQTRGQQLQTPENLKGQREAKGRTPPKPISGSLSPIDPSLSRLYGCIWVGGAVSVGRGSRLQRKPHERGNVLRKGKEGNETLWPENGKSMGGRRIQRGAGDVGGGESIKTNFAWKCCNETQCGTS